MGNQPPPKQNYNPLQEKQKIEIACMKVKYHLELQRDRRLSQANNKEKQLIMLINQSNRSQQEEKHKAASIVSDIQFIDACNILIKCSEILKDRSLHIFQSKGNPDAIKEIMPYIESIVWGSSRVNLQCLQEFNNMMIFFFGSQQSATQLMNESLVDPELKSCFANVMPSDKEINDYLFKLSLKMGITVCQMNEPGHNAQDPSIQKQQQQQQQQKQQQQQQQQQNNYYNPYQQQGGANLNINIQFQDLNQQQQYIQQQQYQPQQVSNIPNVMIPQLEQFKQQNLLKLQQNQQNFPNNSYQQLQPPQQQNFPCQQPSLQQNFLQQANTQNMPQTEAPINQGVGFPGNSMPQMGGNMMPQMGVNMMPQMGGNMMPQMGGNMPQMGGNMPQMGGNMPYIGGNMPQIGGNPHQTGGVMPQTPQTGGNQPGAQGIAGLDDLEERLRKLREGL